MENNPTAGISLQINLSPTDFPICQQLLATQITYFYNLVQEVVLTVETKKSKGKKFGLNFEENKTKLDNLLKHLVLQFPKIRIVPVNYKQDVKLEVAARFFKNTTTIPNKDYRGGPFYSYFFGLYSCKCPLVLHLDSDMFLGGNTEEWLKDALEILNDKSVLFVGPLPGPPTNNFELKQTYQKRNNRYTFQFNNVTTRFFLTDLNKIFATRLRIRLINFSIRKIIKGSLQQNYWELPELLFSDLLKKEDMYRVCYWGRNDEVGCYSLHPLHKPEAFINFIPELLQKISKNDFPEQQRGYYNVHKDVFNFSNAN